MDLVGPDDPMVQGAVPRTLTITLSEGQTAAIVYALMEQSKGLATPEQMEWSRLAITLNDLIVGSEQNEAQPG